jgi:hypothetical protein
MKLIARIVHMSLFDGVQGPTQDFLNLKSFRRQNILTLLPKHTTMATGTDRWDGFPLHAAAFSGDIETIKKLVDGGYAVDTKDSEETTALY